MGIETKSKLKINSIDHFQNKSQLHKRKPEITDHDEIISKNHNSTHIAKLRGNLPEDSINSLHDPVEFSWKQFWHTFVYENLPPIIFSPLAAILFERSLTRAWNVMNHRCLFVFSLKHNSFKNHLGMWLLLYPLIWGVLISLIMSFTLNESLIKNVDRFQIILVYLFISLRSLIVSVKYGFYRHEDYEQLGKSPPYWDEAKTNRRLVGQGWTEPSKFPSLIEDELVCAMDENDVALQGISFKTEALISKMFRNHPTNELFTAKTKYNKEDEVTAGFILHQILSKVYHMRFPTSYMMLTLISGLMIAINTFLIRKYYGLSSFGESSYEIFIYICCLMGLFLGGAGNLNFGFICAHDFNRRYMSLKKLGDLINRPGLKLKNILFFKGKEIEHDKSKIFIDFKIPENIFAWMISRKVLRSFGEVFYLRIQGYTSILLFFAISCVIILNLIAWIEIRHHLSTIWLLIISIAWISSICIHAIFKASKLQNLSSIQRDSIKKELFFLEKELIDAEKKDLKLEIRQINHSKFLLQQVDESINFNELIHKPTRVMGYPATQNVIGSSLGIILTGFVLAVEGFSGSNITYDINGWFNY